MKCPYCGKRTYDMPDHLMANKKCGNKHYEKLRIEMKLMSEYIDGRGNYIVLNGGNPLPGSPKNWDEAKSWERKANKDKEHKLKWSWDCGYKLDYDGPILNISSRFYPPANHYGPTWDGTVTICYMGKEINEKEFDCKNLDELKDSVEKYIQNITRKIEKCIMEVAKELRENHQRLGKKEEVDH